MLLQTNSYIVPKEKRAEHSRLIRRFRQTLFRLGCDHFEVYEQVGSNWSNSESAGRYVQILRFIDRKHQLSVQTAERADPTAQAVIADFCDLINFPYQQQQGLFAVGFYTSVLPVAPKRGARGELVSTVEHEVVDDPEAEKPYPGASDGPPMDEEMEAMIDEPVEPAMAESTLPHESEEPEPIHMTAAEMPDAEVAPADEPAMETFVPIAEHSASESAHVANEEPVTAPAEDDFMSLVGGDLHSHGEANHQPAHNHVEHAKPASLFDEDDEGAHGFIETETLEEQAVEPAQHHQSPDRPEGW